MSDPKSDRTRIIDGQPTRVGPEAPAKPPANAPAIPDVVIESELGRGGMGVVYKGRQGYINRPVAVKLLLQSGGDDSEYVRRFQREATLLAGLNHPHIVACYQAGVTADQHCYLVMEFLDGPNLWQYVKQHGPLAEADALGVIKSIAAALEYARSKGIIHRDVKGENILLAPSGEGGRFPYIAKLVDLGLARPVKPVGDMSLTRQGLLLGTPATMAPEQFDDPEGIDHRADIYGLGCAFFQALTGRPAFAGNSLAQLMADKVSGVLPDPRENRRELSPRISELIAVMLAKDREQRPQTYGDLIARIDAVPAGAAPGARSSARPLLIGAGLVLAVALILVVSMRPAPPSAPAPATMARAEAPAPAAEDSQPVPPAPAPAPAPIAVVPLATTGPIVFAAAQPLHGTEDLRTALEAWTTVPGWGISDENDDLIGHSDSTARITRPIGEAPWRVTGTLAMPTGLAPFREAGVRIELTDGSAWAVTVKDLGSQRYVALTPVAVDGTMAPPRELKQLPAGDAWPVEITCQRGDLVATVAGVACNPVRLQAAPGSLSLTVTKGTVAVRGLALASGR